MPNDTTPPPAGDVRKLVQRLRGLGIRYGKNSDDAWGLVFSWYEARTTENAAKAATALNVFFEKVASELERLERDLATERARADHLQKRLDAAERILSGVPMTDAVVRAAPGLLVAIADYNSKYRAALQPQQQEATNG